MNTQTIDPFNNQFTEICKAIAPETVDTAINQAKKRLEIWRKKSYDERAALLHQVADQMRDKKDPLSKLVIKEIDTILAKGYDGVVCA